MTFPAALRFGFVAAALLLSRSATATEQIALVSGAPVSFTLTGNSFTNSYYIDVGSQAEQLNININGSGGDADLYLRYGTPFADTTFYGNAPDQQLFTRYAHYHSISALSQESILVTKASHEPLRSGRWYLAVSNGASNSSNITLTATAATSQTLASIMLDFNDPSTNCDIAPWNDTTPATPVGGNPGTTRGQQRRNALQHAADLLSLQLATPISVKVRACWEHLGGDNSGATLAHAGPANLVLGDSSFPLPWLTDQYTWYAAAEAVRLGGSSQCGMLGGDCSTPDIEAGFNSDIGSPTVLDGVQFYYGYNPGPPGSGEDFISIAMHEITHGLGFIGLVNVDPSSGTVGAKFTGQGDSGYSGQPAYDDIFDKKIVAVNTDTLTYKGFVSDQSSDSDRMAAMVSGNGLRWSDAEAVNATVNQLNGQSSPNSFPLLYAPCIRDTTSQPCRTSPGSTLSHTVQSGDLMNAFYQLADRTMGLSLPMLHALGWSNDNATAPVYTQPIPSNWYDRTRNGHGFDFQLGFRDPVLGDVYFLIFYTYDNSGNPEWYSAAGHLVDGVFVPGTDANGNSLLRIQYNASTHRGDVDGSVSGSVVVDFNQAANSPACRNADRSGASLLAVMDWQIGSESGQWCMEPIVTLASHPTPDFNGHWYAGNGDAGWGMEILDVRDGSGQPTLIVELYYPDGQGRPRWATANTNNFVSGSALELSQVTGYCRNCAVPASLPTLPVGQITLNLNQALQETAPSGTNTVSLNVTYPGTAGSFTRSATPITLLSAPFDLPPRTAPFQ